MIPFLRYKEDMRTIGFVTFTLSLVFMPFFYSMTGWIVVVHIIVMTLFSFACCVINHNHTHLRTFTSHRANRIFEILLTMAKGHTSKTVIVPHTLNHHVHNGKEEDWARPGLAGDGPGFIRLMRYIFMSIISMKTQRRKKDAPKLMPRFQREAMEERAALVLFIVVLLFMEALTFFIHVLVPWLIAMMMLVAINLLQHDGCDPDSDYNFARNFTGIFSNWLCFNNGYHTIHHMKPALHWSRAPEEHERLIKPYIDPALDQKSILLFLFSRYGFN